MTCHASFLCYQILPGLGLDYNEFYPSPFGLDTEFPALVGKGLTLLATVLFPSS